MNKSKIEYVDQTWNPVTGCLNDCPYCYARKIANRFDGHFNPTIHYERMDEPFKMRKPQNIFVCSMADLFGSWVEDDWIKEVFTACKRTHLHRFLFLTKNPMRYINLAEKYVLPMTKNFWYGSTITNPATEYFWADIYNTFLSIEPLQEEFTSFDGISLTNWVIVGAETGNRKGKVIPKREWIENIVKACRKLNVPVFMKNSLTKIWGEPLIQEYPW
jgi:protein gp37